MLKLFNLQNPLAKRSSIFRFEQHVWCGQVTYKILIYRLYLNFNCNLQKISFISRPIVQLMNWLLSDFKSNRLFIEILVTPFHCYSYKKSNFIYIYAELEANPIKRFDSITTGAGWKSFKKVEMKNCVNRFVNWSIFN